MRWKRDGWHRWFAGLGAACLRSLPVGVLAAVPAAAEWSVEAYGSLSGPVAPSFFTDGWGSGLGIGGGFGVSASRLQFMLEGEFQQFSYDGVQGLGDLGGERRLSRLALAVRLDAWERQSEKRESLSLSASAGWGHQSIAGTFGEGASSPEGEILGDGSEDGWALTGGMEFSRSLYRSTRWAVGVRYAQHRFSTETPAYTSLVLGLRMPLAGVH